MRRVYLTAFCVVAIGISTNADAANWVFVDSSNKAGVYIDWDSIERSGNRVTAWEKWIYKPDAKRVQAEAKIRNRYDCVSRTIKLLYSINYAENGSVISSFTFNEYDAPPSPVVPESIGEAVLDRACGGSANIPPPG